MSNDAKLGLIVGLGLVLTIGFVFFRKEPATAQTSPVAAAPTAVTPVPPPVPDPNAPAPVPPPLDPLPN